MRVVQRFGDEERHHGGLANSPVLYPIYIEHDGQAYPTDRWMDFGLAILGMWLYSVEELLAGAPQARLPFMDGPYGLHATRLSADVVQLELQGEKERWVVGLPVLARAIIDGAEAARRALVDEPSHARETRGWDEGIARLEARLGGAGAPPP